MKAREKKKRGGKKKEKKFGLEDIELANKMCLSHKQNENATVMGRVVELSRTGAMFANAVFFHSHSVEEATFSAPPSTNACCCAREHNSRHLKSKSICFTGFNQDF